MSDTLSASQRAGRCATQTNGYRAFIPVPLPPDPLINIDSKLQNLLSKADRAQRNGILEELTGQKRNRRFMYSQYIRLFRDSD